MSLQPWSQVWNTGVPLNSNCIHVCMLQVKIQFSIQTQFFFFFFFFNFQRYFLAIQNALLKIQSNGLWEQRACCRSTLHRSEFFFFQTWVDSQFHLSPSPNYSRGKSRINPTWKKFKLWPITHIIIITSTKRQHFKMAWDGWSSNKMNVCSNDTKKSCSSSVDWRYPNLQRRPCVFDGGKCTVDTSPVDSLALSQ